MTALEVHDSLLVEINQVQSSSIPLEDFNYFFNKAINNVSNKKYNQYEINQQLTDDLRVLQAPTLEITPSLITTGLARVNKATYSIELPVDYYHILACALEFRAIAKYKCRSTGDIFITNATKLTTQVESGISDNAYFKPSIEQPYFQFVSISNNSPDTTSNLRKSNREVVNLQIKYGKDVSRVVLDKVHVEYLRSPETIKLTQAQLDADIDNSQTLEFPDYMNQEIVNELTILLLENFSDIRIQTNPIINNTIAPATPN